MVYPLALTVRMIRIRIFHRLPQDPDREGAENQLKILMQKRCKNVYKKIREGNLFKYLLMGGTNLVGK
jgi:hypothetical protein